MRWTTRLFLLIVSLLCVGGMATAQRDVNELRAWVRFEITPGVNLSGPFHGTVRFQIGRGSVRAMQRPRIELQVVHLGKVEARYDLPKLPALFDWDTSKLPNDRYYLRLVAIDERNQVEMMMDEIRGKVDNPKLDPLPIIDSNTSNTAGTGMALAPVWPPTPTFARRGDGVVSGILSMPIEGWSEGTPAKYIPVVDIYQNGRRVDSQGTGGKFPFVLNWDTNATKNGVYTLKLTVLNLANNSDTGTGDVTTDEMTVTVQNTVVQKDPDAGSESVKPMPVPAQGEWSRGKLSSRNGMGVLRGGSNKDQFKWVVLISKAFGDPFPQVAAAQWALESSWGKSTSGQNNYFGIKATGDQAGTERVTNEWGDNGIYSTTARFADYDSPTDCIAARIKFLKKPRYSGYWTAGSADAAARALQRGGYATDPSYASQLISIMRRMGY